MMNNISTSSGLTLTDFKELGKIPVVNDGLKISGKCFEKVLIS